MPEGISENLPPRKTGIVGKIIRTVRESLPWDPIGKKKRATIGIPDEVIGSLSAKTKVDKPKIRVVPTVKVLPTEESGDLPSQPRVRTSTETSVPSESLKREIKIGEPKEGAPLLFIDDTAYKAVTDHLKGDLRNERGGLLIGHIKPDKTSLEVTGFIPATSSQSKSPVRFEFTHEDWANFARIREGRGRGEAVVGWVHSHPKIEPAPSRFDIFIQGYFNMPGQFSLIIDPVNNTLGIFRLKEGESINEGGFMLKGNLPNNGLTQVPRVTVLNSLTEILGSSTGISK